MTFIPSYQVVLEHYPLAQQWVTLLSNLGRSHATLDAYARALAHYLRYCEASNLLPESVTFEQITLYIRNQLPGQPQAVANSTLHQRLTAIRLWYDHLVFMEYCQQNPVPRGQHLQITYVPNHAGFVRGVVPRLIQLPKIPSDEEWNRLLQIVSSDSTRNKLMLALAYYGALRRAELVSLCIEDIDVAHRLITLKAERTKNQRGRVVCYSPAIAPVLLENLRQMYNKGWRKGPLFRSDSDRNRGMPLTKWSWSKIVQGWAKEADIPYFSTHTLRHLRLTHLARAGWKLHELTTYAGHRNPKTTIVYLHLSGSDLSAKMAHSLGNLDSRLSGQLFGE